jgi:hypothetical protein
MRNQAHTTSYAWEEARDRRGLGLKDAIKSSVFKWIVGALTAALLARIAGKARSNALKGGT